MKPISRVVARRAEAGQLIDEDMARAVEDSGIETVRIRSVLTCEAARAVPDVLRPQPRHHGYGGQGRSGRHHRGAVNRRAGAQLQHAHVPHRWNGSTSNWPHSRRSGRNHRVRRSSGHWSNADGLQIVTSYEGELTIRSASDNKIGARLQVPLGATLVVKDGEVVKKDQVIFSWDPYSNPIISDVEGTIRFVDLVPDESMSEELDELTGLRQTVVIEDREKKLHLHIEIWETKGAKEKRLRDFVIPVGAQLTVHDGQRITGCHPRQGEP